MAYFLSKRGDNFYYLRRVPVHLKKYDSRPFVRISLKTKDPLEAQRRALVQNAAMEKYWADLVKHKNVHSLDEKWKDAVTIVRTYGYSYTLIEDMKVNTPLLEMVERMNILVHKKDDPKTVQAISGLTRKPGIKISAAVKTYFSLSKDKTAGKSKDFIRKWENPRKRAVNNFIEAIGDDKSIGEISRTDINKFHAWWMDKISEEGMNPGSATKDMVHLKDVLRIAFSNSEIDYDVNVMFASAKFKNINVSRSPFEAKFVQNEILKPGKLDSLNEEARALIYVMSDTGARVSEVVGLLPEDIFLNEEIPFIWIRPNEKRSLKNRPSQRQIPLVGAALMGIKMVASGFPRYKTADSASNLINQFMSENELKPSPMHSLYSLRHTFKDRLRDVGAPEEVTDELMGHAGHRPHYGRGHTLKTKYEWLKKIEFKV